MRLSALDHGNITLFLIQCGAMLILLSVLYLKCPALGRNNKFKRKVLQGLPKHNSLIVIWNLFCPKNCHCKALERFVFMLFDDNFTFYEFMSLIWRTGTSSHWVRNLNLSRFVGQVSQCFVAMRYLWGSMKNVVQSIVK
jgi:hypothetical protein